MPLPMLKGLAKKAGHSEGTAEQYWNEAKESAKKEGFQEGTPRFYRYTTGIVKRRLGLGSEKAAVETATKSTYDPHYTKHGGIAHSLEKGGTTKKAMTLHGVNFPAGAKVHQLPGGVFVHHPEVKEKALKTTYHPKYGHMIQRTKEHLDTITDALHGKEHSSVEIAKSKKWSGKVTKKDKHDTPDKLFTHSGSKIAKYLHEKFGGAEAEKKINFYINRAGKNLHPADKKRLEGAKNKIEKHLKGAEKAEVANSKTYVHHRKTKEEMMLHIENTRKFNELPFNEDQHKHKKEHANVDDTEFNVHKDGASDFLQSNPDTDPTWGITHQASVEETAVRKIYRKPSEGSSEFTNHPLVKQHLGENITGDKVSGKSGSPTRNTTVHHDYIGSNKDHSAQHAFHRGRHHVAFDDGDHYGSAGHADLHTAIEHAHAAYKKDKEENASVETAGEHDAVINQYWKDRSHIRTSGEHKQYADHHAEQRDRQTAAGNHKAAALHNTLHEQHKALHEQYHAQEQHLPPKHQASVETASSSTNHVEALHAAHKHGAGKAIDHGGGKYHEMVVPKEGVEHLHKHLQEHGWKKLDKPSDDAYHEYQKGQTKASISKEPIKARQSGPRKAKTDHVGQHAMYVETYKHHASVEVALSVEKEVDHSWNKESKVMDEHHHQREAQGHREDTMEAWQKYLKHKSLSDHAKDEQTKQYHHDLAERFKTITQIQSQKWKKHVEES